MAYAIIAAFVALFSACGMSDSDKVATAVRIVGERSDSALVILRDVEVSSLNETDRARYILTKAEADLRSYRTLVTDSLLPEAFGYYKANGPFIDYVKTAKLYVSYLLSRKSTDDALAILDETIASIPADSVDLQYSLRAMRMNLVADQEQYERAIAESDWLIYHTRFDNLKFRYSYYRMYLLWLAGRSADAIAWGDSIRVSSYMPGIDTPQGADFMGDYAEILDESGRSADAIGIVEDVLDGNPGFSSEQKVGFLVSLAKFNANTGNLAKAKQYLAEAESLDFNPDNIDNDFKNYLTFLHGAINFKETGHLYGTPSKHLVDELRMQRLINRDAIQEMNALSAQKLETQIERQRLWLAILAACMVILAVSSVAFWMIRRRQRRLHEAEERIETLDEMLGQVAQSHDDDKKTVVKKLALQQMGILKTFAAAPSTQNQEVLKKISSIGKESGAPAQLVDWESLYAMIDELYDGFHSKILEAYPGVFSEKELRIISLMRADFATKEIGVLTEQSSATVYVRKSAIRKKLGTTEGGDFMAQIKDRVQGI